MANTSRNRGIGIVTASDSQERSKGQLHIYDGEGKGKSQAALGVVLRTIGLGICEKRQSRVLLLRFLKGPDNLYNLYNSKYNEEVQNFALQQMGRRRRGEYTDGVPRIKVDSPSP